MWVADELQEDIPDDSEVEMTFFFTRDKLKQRTVK